MIGVAILLVAARPMLHVLLDRCDDRSRWLSAVSLAAPLVASGTLVLVVMFREQTPGHRLRDGQDPVERGAGHPRYQEFMRYYFMSVATDDAALAAACRCCSCSPASWSPWRFCCGAATFRGLNNGPVWRLIGVSE